MKSSSYWRSKKDGNISNCWISNGYEIKNLDMKNQKIVFTRCGNKLSLKIPNALLQEKIPRNAKIEFETFAAYLIKKYGL